MGGPRFSLGQRLRTPGTSRQKEAMPGPGELQGTSSWRCKLLLVITVCLPALGIPPSVRMDATHILAPSGPHLLRIGDACCCTAAVCLQVPSPEGGIQPGQWTGLRV